MNADEESQAVKVLTDRIASLEASLTDSRTGVRLSALFDGLFEGVQIIDFDYRYVYLNTAAARHGRIPADELIGRTMSEGFPGIEDSQMFDHVVRCMEERTAVHMCNEFHYDSGDVGWFDLRMNPVPMGVIIFSVDVTERVRTERALRDANEHLRITLECMSEAVVTTDTHGCITDMNPAAEALTGWSLSESKGEPAEDIVQLLDQDSRLPIRHLTDKILENRRRFSLANGTLLRIRSGEAIPIVNGGAPLRNDDGSIRGTVMVIKDMQEEQRLMAMLHQAQKMEAIGRLTGGIAHDFNNILMVISGYATLADQQASGQAPLSKHISEIRTSANRAAEITRQLLTFSRKKVMNKTVLNMNAILEGMHDMLCLALGEQIELQLQLDPNLSMTRSDEVHIEQVVMNLAVNARDAMPDGGLLTISTSNIDVDEVPVPAAEDQLASPYIKMTVRDTGSGMDDSTLSRIFEPFYTSKSPDQGTGLGLSTVYNIIDQCGGVISVNSVIDQGTCFEIFLPCVAEPATVPSRPEHLLTPAVNNETVLVVDDDSSVLTLLVTVLEDAGFNVCSAANGKEALEQYRQHSDNIDLLLTDVILPGMNGRQIASAIHEQDPQLPVIYISGYTDDDQIKRELLKAEAELVLKPIEVNALIEKICTVLARHNN